MGWVVSLRWERWKHGGIEELARSKRDGDGWFGSWWRWWDERGRESVRFWTRLGWDVSEFFDRIEDVWKVWCSNEA